MVRIDGEGGLPSGNHPRPVLRGQPVPERQLEIYWLVPVVLEPYGKREMKLTRAMPDGPFPERRWTAEGPPVTKRRVLKSPKLSRSHSTFIPEARAVIESLKAHPAVTKIALGVIDAGHRRPPGLSARDIPAGLKVFVRGSGAVQTLFVYTADRVAVRRSLGLA